MLSIVILIAILTVNCFVLYKKTNQFLLPSPSFVVSAMFLLFATMVFLNYDFFDEEISFVTIIVIMACILSMQCTELCFTKIQKVKYIHYKADKIDEYITRWKLILATCIIAVNTILRYKRFIDIGSALGANDFFSSYIAIRLATTNAANGVDVDGFYDPTRIEIFLGNIATAAAYICLYYLIKSIVFGRKKNWICFAPICAYLPSLIFETGRSAFFGIIVFIILSFLFLFSVYHKTVYWNSTKGKRMIMKAGAGFLLFFAVSSVMMQSDKDEKVGGELGVVNYMSLYVGSSLINFNHYVVEDESKSDYPGQLTFRDTFNNLRSLGLETKRPEVHLENYYWKGNNREYGSNVFTGFYMAIKDFGYIGSVILFCFIGIFYGLMNTKINSIRFDFESALPIYIIALVYGTAIWLPYTYQYYSFFSIGFLIRICLFSITEKFLISKVRQ